MKPHKDMDSESLDYIQQHSEKELEYYKERHRIAKNIEYAGYYFGFVEYYQSIIMDIQEIKFTYKK